ncbi:MAG: hypothetical protein HY290_06570 [Planctomycetia bacterium]|nr:hypothetical protein [Planctomycetia bacterium]
MRRWLRVTLPTDWAVSGYIMLYVVLEVIHWRLMGPGIENSTTSFLIEAGAFVYGALRMLGFHPVFNPEYFKWLSATPWTDRYPLPAGPVRLVLQDVLVVGFLMLVAWLHHPSVRPLLLPIKFLLAYEMALAISFIMLRMVWFSYAIGFAFGLIALTWNDAAVTLPIAAVLYGVSLIGINIALRDFAKWDLAWMEDQQPLALNQQRFVERMRSKVLGWPFDCLRPKEDSESVTYREGVVLSLLFGWWVLVAILRIDPLRRADVWRVLFVLVSMPGVMARLAIYYWGYASPLSFWARVFRLRWIIPGYDYAALAPLSAIVIASLGGVVVATYPDHVPAIAPATITLIAATLFNLGPSVKRWRLTGNHRLSPAMLMANKQSELQQI